MSTATEAIQLNTSETGKSTEVSQAFLTESQQTNKSGLPNLEVLKLQAQEDTLAELNELQAKNPEDLTVKEEQRLNALRLGQQNVSYLQGSYGEQAISNRSPDGTIQQKYIKTTIGNFDGVNRMQIESERVVIDPTGTFSSQGKNTYTPTTQKVGNAGL